ncbi:BZ3500_MvSof-1268-A1-R1_Chr1-1g00895 [Microbotryum saponariae]|uniref:ATP synthase subunit 4 n=1 Tax=Microbotryum saponariae TaxID=289078 RepID=A0A2X0MCW5_9BASI|nr:BZ3500_MvSof-1268-A1-R1_Chr1-1g00895 [Microbotryum saponariae]SCZ92881.1 BZ3501_MvSof-1269-A2-R1_Chr1-1g00492 [Microbotryum saponariae]
MLARTAARSALRPAVRSAVVAPSSLRFASSASEKPAPAVKANALIDALPGNSLVSKTGIITATTAVAAAGISSELFVLNEEVVILGSFVIFVGYVASAVRGPYTEWANGQIDKIRGILNSARATHTQAVQGRIDSVGEMKDVEALTKQLFELSKQTAKLEHETFTLKQQTALTSDIKSVLDSWVRHEAQVREQEQRDLVQTVLENVQKTLTDKKLQKDILVAAVADVEALVKSKAI